MDESRKQFEAVAANKLNFDISTVVASRNGDTYDSGILTIWWHFWQQSRAAIEIELPKPHAHLIWIQAGYAPDDYWEDVAVSYSEKDKCCDGSERYPVHAGWEIEEVLRAAGIKVKE